MPLLSASADTFLLALVSFAVFMYRKSGGDKVRSEFRSYTTSFVVLHTIYIIYVLCFFRPPNLFTRLHIPLSTPSERIRSLILKRANLSDGLPDHLEELLTRLSSFDLRTFYIRFGQNVVQECDYCHTFGEYAFYSIAGIVLLYLREAAAVGLLTIRGTHRERWRKYGLGLLIFSAIVEIYWTLTVEIRISQGNSYNVVMWHDTLWTVRHLLFLFLPLAIHFLFPASHSISPLAAVPMTNLALQSLMRRIQLLKFTDAASSRVPELRQASAEFWDKHRNEGQWAREDESVQRTAELAGVTLRRETAAEIVAGLKQGFETDVFVS